MYCTESCIQAIHGWKTLRKVVIHGLKTQHMNEWIKEGTSFFKSQNSLLKFDQ